MREEIGGVRERQRRGRRGKWTREGDSGGERGKTVREAEGMREGKWVRKG